VARSAQNKTRFPGQVEYLELNEKQVAALASVACDEVYSALSSIEARSVREVAEEIGKSPASVGEQLAKLVKVGLVIQVGTRKRRSRTEATYAQTALVDRVRVPERPSKIVQVYFKRFQAQMRQLVKQFDAAQKALLRDRSFVAFFMSHSRIAHLSPVDSLVVKQKVRELIQLVNELDESDPEVRRAGGHVRTTLAVQLLPTVHESKKLSGKS
jgi:predicted transcriptional regulator